MDSPDTAFYVAVGLFWLTQAFAAGPRLEVTPERAFIDEPVKIIVQGLPTKQPVRVSVSASDDLGRRWESHAEFLPDAHGRVDVAHQRPESGTYQGADTGGLFWSMGLRTNDQAASPFACDSLKPIEYALTAEVGDEVLARAKLQRSLVAPGIQRILVHDANLRGTLFVPSGKGSHAGVILLGGSDGGLHEVGAAFLASKGFTAFALAYFGFQDLPKSLDAIPLEYFEAAMKWLQSRKEVRHDQIAVIGGSRGGELALLLGTKFRQIKAVVALAPSGVVWGGLSAEGGPEKPAWTYEGHPVPFMSIENLTPDQHKRIEEVFQSKSSSPEQLFEIMLENRAGVDKATIPVEQINGPILLISGKVDRIWSSTMLADRVMQRLKQARHPFPDQHLVYEGAGHFIPIPNLPTTVSTMVHPVTKMEINFGGDAAHTAVAANNAWAQIVSFLHQRLR